MKTIGNIKVLFVAGFGPIVRDSAASQRLYRETLGIPFKEADGGYFHTGNLSGVKHFSLWPLSQAAQSCFGSPSWPEDVPIPQGWIEFDVDSVEEQRRSWNREDTRCLLPAGKSRGARR